MNHERVAVAVQVSSNLHELMEGFSAEGAAFFSQMSPLEEEQRNPTKHFARHKTVLEAM